MKKTGLTNIKISTFLKFHYELQNYEHTPESLLLFNMHFQKQEGNL